MPVLVVGDGEFGWRAPYRASPAKSCFKAAAAAGALVVFSPERYTSTFSSSMTKGMDFWSADSLPIYGPQVRLPDVTENAPRCNHRKKHRDFRSHEGGFPVIICINCERLSYYLQAEELCVSGFHTYNKYHCFEAQRQAMPVLVVGDGEFGWRAPYRASPAKSCFRTAAAAGALVVFSPERYTSTFSSSMTKGMDFWSADSLPIYGPQVRLLDVTENAPRCNHRKKRQDFRSHEGGANSKHCLRLKSDTSPALFVHPVGGVQDVQPQPRVIVHRDRNSRQHMNANFYSYCLTRGVVQEYMLPPWLHAAWTAVPPDEW
ncbi:hypothetical protein SeMB42_g00855 [Synchytrium endobioticum]|uniref:Uncharacterized protein n=1 Tax=Synchytrium endobioticum TaxID=286115 RepID=A0A507DR39_9FUNG|nr:hypothetical protein SeMB42_g00855 [Synchytrium endobioticum]